MKFFYTLFAISIFFLNGIFAQVYNNPGDTIITCSGTFYDSGGELGNYLNGESITTTFCPANAGEKIILDFYLFEIESFFDSMTIYDGASTAAPLLGAYSGIESPGLVLATNATGCLTVHYTSDFSITDVGWAANVFCSDYATIHAISYYDLNQNQVQDNGEPTYNNANILLAPSGLVAYPNTGGGSTFYTAAGNYTVTYDLADPNWALSTDSASYFLSLGANEVDTVSFGVYPTQMVSEQIAFINSPPARCNEDIIFDISTQNTGTTITSGIMWFAVDTNTTTVNFITPPDTIVPPNLYGWNFTDLYPGQTFGIQIEIGIPGPLDFQLGDLLNFEAYVNYTDVNGTQTSSIFEYHTEVQCSFDPNDKLVFPSRNTDFPVNYTLFDESLYYTVRFQNTGNAEAYDVVIKDTLDANLDWTTFQFLGSSHADVLTTTMDEDGILTFDFTDIFLPDSTSNFEGSQGYVSYLIKANSGLAENTIIENSAGIYFDFNPPVITNTTENVMVSVLPTISTTSPEDVPEIIIIPNPNTGLFEISGIAQGDYTILNTAGQVIQVGQLSNNVSIDISAVPQGVYFISIQMDEQTVVKRVVKL